MKSVLILFFVSIVFASSAQSIKKGKKYFDKKNYDKALVCFNKFTSSSDSTPESKQKVATAYLWIAKVYQEIDSTSLAIENYKQSIKHYIACNDTLSENLVEAYNLLGDMFFNVGQYNMVPELYYNAYNIIKQLYEHNTIEYGESCNKLANAYMEVDKLEEAVELSFISLHIYKNTLGAESDDHITVLGNIANAYIYQGIYDTALVYCEKAFYLLEKKGANNTDKFADICSISADIYEAQGKNKEAKAMLKKSLAIYEDLYGKKSETYINEIMTLAGVYSNTEEFERARKSYIEIINICKDIYGTGHPLYIVACNNLAGIYSNLCQPNKAEPLYLEAKLGIKKLLGEQHSAYATLCNNTAQFYWQNGYYEQAEVLYNEAREILINSVGVKHPSYANTTNNLGILYLDMGNYKRAEELLIEGKNARESIYGKMHSEYAASCNNLAELYRANKRTDKTLNLIKESRNAYKQSQGIDSRGYFISTNNLGLTYDNMGNYAEAKKLYAEAKQIQERTLGKEHTSYVKSCQYLGGVNYYLHLYDTAEILYLEALQIQQRVLNKNVKTYSDIYRALGNLYFDMGKMELAEKYFTEGLAINKENIKKNFSFLSEKEKTGYFESMQSIYNKFLLFALDRKSANPKISEQAYNIALTNKGLSLKSSTAMRKTILNSNDSVLLNQYDEWISLRKQLIKNYTSTNTDQDSIISELEDKANGLERMLVKSSSSFANFNNSFDLDWNDVKNSLKHNEAAIEFMHFLNEKDSSIIYCALIVSPNSTEPELVYLFKEHELEDILGEDAKKNYGFISAEYSNKEVPVHIYNLIWKPIEKHVDKANTLYISPTGLLHKIPFSSIVMDKNTFLCDKYNIHTNLTTAQVINRENIDKIANYRVSVFGGVNYEKDSNNFEAWKYLPGTLTEGQNIFSYLTENGLNTRLYTDTLASEKQFKVVAEQSNIIHVATHGFFFSNYKPSKRLKLNEPNSNLYLSANMRANENSVRNRFSTNKNPLLRSGIVLSGANKYWNNDYTANNTDGIITAYEVANLNLNKTKLVVLSACKTGLGSINDNEGVYGLQRAFKIAGSDYIIMTLWRIFDKETEEFMTQFYKYIVHYNDIPKAYFETQKQMRKKYDPYFWAGFVLIH